MSCPYDREELSAYVDAEVEEAAAAGIREHLRGCGTCRREVSSLKMLARMVGALPRVEPDAALTWTAERLASPTATALHCPVVLPEASALIDGEVSGEAAQSVVGHLASCDPCHRAYRDLERISEALAATEPVPVPAGLEARILTAIEAEGRFSLRRWLLGACEVCTPKAQVALRFAAAAAFIALLALGVIHAIAPTGVSLEAVLAPTATVAVAPEAAGAAEPAVAGSPERGALMRPRPEPIGAGPGAPRPSLERGARRAETAERERRSPTGPVAPTVVRPPGEALVSPTPSAPAPPPAPRRDLAPVGTMMASRPPSQPPPPSETGGPGTSRPLSSPAKATPGPEPVAPAEPPPTRVAERRPPVEPGSDVHVRVPRSTVGAPAAPPSRGIDPESLRAAEARLTETLRSVSRSQPKSFRINP